jgi:hypothetical protein
MPLRIDCVNLQIDSVNLVSDCVNLVSDCESLVSGCENLQVYCDFLGIDCENLQIEYELLVTELQHQVNFQVKDFVNGFEAMEKRLELAIVDCNKEKQHTHKENHIHFKLIDM